MAKYHSPKKISSTKCLIWGMMGQGIKHKNMKNNSKGLRTRIDTMEKSEKKQASKWERQLIFSPKTSETKGCTRKTRNKLLYFKV